MDKNRKRNQTICFRMTPEERRELEARIIVSGMPKGKYFIQSLLYQEIRIAVGKYQSDRLRLEIRRLRERLEDINTENKELQETLVDCRALMKQIIKITGGDSGVRLMANDFRTVMQDDEK
ncbi:plasmid mobilization protein [Blautia sp. AF26-2]|uniref:plasmid mobilization protein n=1 Tax=Blautia sp. AF26-2 TaxID=2292966 RepID=UPI003FA47EC1